jgi:hypothetical protein
MDDGDETQDMKRNQTGVISDSYADTKQTLAWLHNLHGHQL